MEQGDIIPELAINNNSNLKITRKRQPSVQSPTGSGLKKGCNLAQSPDGPIHKNIPSRLESRRAVIIMDGEESPEKTPPRKCYLPVNEQDVVTIDDGDEAPHLAQRTETVYYSANASPEKLTPGEPSSLNALTLTDALISAGNEKKKQKISDDAIIECDTEASSVSSEGILIDEKDAIVVPSNEERMIMIKNHIKTHKFVMLPDFLRVQVNDTLYFFDRQHRKGHIPTPIKMNDEHAKSLGSEQITLPWSHENTTKQFRRYIAIEKSLKWIRDEMSSIDTLYVGMEEYDNIQDFSAIQLYYEELPSNEDRKQLLTTISKMAELALRGKELFPESLKVLTLYKNENVRKNASISFTQEQCACLLANAFFSTFPKKDHLKSYRRPKKNSRELYTNSQTEYVWFDMLHFFDSTNEMAVKKLKFIFNYFRIVTNVMPTGTVSFRRASSQREFEMDDALKSKDEMPLLAFADGSINDQEGCLHVDFANKYIGGGVLRDGCVQEEIMFLEYPEMMVSMLICPKMNSHEAIFIAGAQRFNDHEGYGYSVCWKEYIFNEDDVARDIYGRVKNEIVALDAQDYSHRRKTQYDQDAIERELYKLFAGFKSYTGRPETDKPVATGNWGCGVFKGDLQLKCLIQLVAAGITRRKLVYCAFNEHSFRKKFEYVYEVLVKQKVTSGDLLNMLCSYNSSPKSSTVFEFVLDMTLPKA